MFRTRRFKWIALLATLSAGTMMQATFGCNQLWTGIGLSSFNFCSVLNCTGGTYFNFCSPAVLLVDCPQP
jgi:hypothetical protein